MKIRVKPSGEFAFVGDMRINGEQDIAYTPDVARKINDGELVFISELKKGEKTSKDDGGKKS